MPFSSEGTPDFVEAFDTRLPAMAVLTSVIVSAMVLMRITTTTPSEIQRP